MSDSDQPPTRAALQSLLSGSASHTGRWSTQDNQVWPRSTAGPPEMGLPVATSSRKAKGAGALPSLAPVPSARRLAGRLDFIKIFVFLTF